MNNIKSLQVHDAKAQFLDDLAMLMGCQESIGSRLPDGSRPDVLRINQRNRMLFLGDAKNSETPGCIATRFRLRNYLNWMSVHLNGSERSGIFALCFGRSSDCRGWERTLSTLCYESKLNPTGQGVVQFSPDLTVHWNIFKSNSKLKNLSSQEF